MAYYKFYYKFNRKFSFCSDFDKKVPSNFFCGILGFLIRKENVDQQTYLKNIFY